jgi:hypothetical protein
MESMARKLGTETVPEPTGVTVPSSRDLVRTLRALPTTGSVLPESIAWHAYLELRRRGEPDAARLFLAAVKGLHARRCIPSVVLPTDDPSPDDHRNVEDAFLADLWKAYKKCIRSHRTGPAGQLIRDMEEHLAVH